MCSANGLVGTRAVVGLLMHLDRLNLVLDSKVVSWIKVRQTYNSTPGSDAALGSSKALIGVAYTVRQQVNPTILSVSLTSNVGAGYIRNRAVACWKPCTCSLVSCRQSGLVAEHTDRLILSTPLTQRS